MLDNKASFAVCTLINPWTQLSMSLCSGIHAARSVHHCAGYKWSICLGVFLFILMRIVNNHNILLPTQSPIATTSHNFSYQQNELIVYFVDPEGINCFIPRFCRLLQKWLDQPNLIDVNTSSNIDTSHVIVYIQKFHICSTLECKKTILLLAAVEQLNLVQCASSKGELHRKSIEE